MWPRWVSLRPAATHAKSVESAIEATLCRAPGTWRELTAACALPDVNGENFYAAINAELHKISTFYVDKEEELDVSGSGSSVNCASRSV